MAGIATIYNAPYIHGWVRNNRLAKGLSQRELSEIVDLHVDDVFAHEHGNRYPTQEQVDRYAAAFGFSDSPKMAIWQPKVVPVLSCGKAPADRDGYCTYCRRFADDCDCESVEV